MYLYLHCVLRVIFYLILSLSDIHILRSKTKLINYVQNSIFKKNNLAPVIFIMKAMKMP